MSMKKAFIWVSGLRFIDQKNLLMARNFFGFLAKNKPVWASGKTKNIPGANWLKKCSNIKSGRAFSYRTPCTIGMRDVFCTPHVCIRYLAQSIRIRVTFSMSLSIHVHVQCTSVYIFAKGGFTFSAESADARSESSGLFWPHWLRF